MLGFRDMMMSSLQNSLRTTTFELEKYVQALGDYFERPLLINYGGLPTFRHKNLNGLLASYLKCVRIVSSLNASLALLEKGFVQEVYVLCRCIDEFCEDIWFLSSPLGADGYSNDQARFVKEFFQEEFDQPSNPLKSTQKRDRVPRKKIHAAISRLEGHPVNPSDAKELQRTLHQTFSGYVHGAYPHIMELYGGSSPHYHTAGMRDTPRIPGCEKQLVSYVYRSIIAVQVVARRAGAPHLDTVLSRLAADFEKQTGCINEEHTEDDLTRGKKQGLKKDT